jgi:nucleoside-diphosphate-sugar epimerase
LLRPSKVNKKMFAPYADEPGLEIVWGDLTDPGDVDRAVRGVDIVLHPAAMISPAADRNPSLAQAINVGGTRNLVDSILREPEGAERVRLVGVGSVAQYGDRLPPLEMIRVGDPLLPSVYDYYALTKCAAERLIVESGIKHWASLRQTFIVPPDLLGLLDPILFHQPLDQRIELITARDAGYGLVQCLNASDEFWGGIYNMSGGPRCRVVYQDFIADQFTMAGLGDYRKIFEPNWFALKNFHCGYFADSDVLDHHLGHFRDTLDDCYAMIEQALAPWMKIGARLAPAPLLRMLARRWAEPLHWIERDDTAYIDAFFGSRAAWEAIPGWHGR